MYRIMNYSSKETVASGLPTLKEADNESYKVAKENKGEVYLIVNEEEAQVEGFIVVDSYYEPVRE